MNDYKFGNFLCSVREAKGLTQAQVADALGITAAAVSKWENGSAKPRVEMLFRLAELLEVRPEELMAGEYIKNDGLDPEAVKRINERYELLQRVDESNQASIKFKRLLAWLIDWNIIGLFVLLLAGAYAAAVIGPTNGSNAAIIGLFPIFLLYPTLFILRDVIFGGRSIGKRIFGLVILDRRNGEALRGKELALRNLFVFILQIDAVVMLISGYSIGDRAVNAAVTKKEKREDGRCEVDRLNAYGEERKNGRRTLIISVIAVVLAIALFVAFLFILIRSVLDSKKDTEEYAIAYEYLINSETFIASGTKEEDIRFNTYSKNAGIGKGGKRETTVELGFVLKGGARVSVILHGSEGKYAICEECTSFN